MHTSKHSAKLYLPFALLIEPIVKISINKILSRHKQLALHAPYSLLFPVSSR